MFFVFQGAVLGRVSNFRIPTKICMTKNIYLWCVGWFRGLNVCDFGLCWTKISIRKKRRFAEIYYLHIPPLMHFPIQPQCFETSSRGVHEFTTRLYHLPMANMGGMGSPPTWLDNFAAGSSPEMRLDIGGKWSGKAHFLLFKPSVVTVTEGVSHRQICIWQVSDWVIESPECVFFLRSCITS